MRLTPPTIPVFLVAIILAAVSVVSMFTHLPVVHGWVNADHHRYWIMAAAFVVMTLGVVFPGL